MIPFSLCDGPRGAMKAIVFHRHGGPEVLKYADAPEPALRANDVLVRVKACALNHLDLWVRRGLPNVPIPLPHIPGSDVAGEIARIGADVTAIRVGQKVVLAPLVSCGKCTACLAGLDNHCRQASNLGYMIDGGSAEFVRAPEVNCLAYPENLKWEEAAAIPLVFQTAWHMLVTRGELQAGEDVLILGAGSGVGSAAIQIAKFFGARVITTAGSEEKLAKAGELGADHLINYKTQKIRDDVLKHHVHATFVGDAAHLVTCGATTGYDAKVDLRFLFSRQLSLLGSYMGTKSELHTVMKLVTAGHLRPIVDRVFPLAEAAAAHDYLESRSQFGKVALHS